MPRKSNISGDIAVGEMKIENKNNAEEDIKLFRNLHVAHMMVFKAREQELKKYGVSYEEVQTLNALRSIGGKPTVTDITHISVKNYHTIAAIVKRLQGKGLVKKEQDPSTKGLWRLIITDKGQKVLEQAYKTETLSSVFSVFSAAEREQFDSFLQRACKSAILYSALKDVHSF